MKIAFTSYEYPPDTGGGGIGTYLFSIRKYLVDAGHEVFIFCGTHKEEIYEDAYGAIRIPSKNWVDFNSKVADVFRQYHAKVAFDILEGTDFQASGREIKNTFPDLPYVVRLHTPNFVSDQLNYQPLDFKSKVRFVLGGILKGRINWIPSSKAIPSKYPHEFENLRLADALLSPSKAIYRYLRPHLPKEHNVGFVAFPFASNDNSQKRRFLKDKSSFKIVFAGRMEKRKGIIEFVEAIKEVKKQVVDIQVLIAGKSSVSPVKNLSMENYLKSRYVERFQLPIQFLGKLSYEKTQQLLQEADLFVFPSYWESFGMVVFEAMSYGVPVICTSNSAPAEYVQSGKTGLIAKPRDVRSLANALLKIYSDRQLGENLGTAAKSFIEEKFAPAKIVSEQVKFYEGVIGNKNRNLSKNP